MIVYIFHRTLYKYESTKDDLNKLIISNILKKEKDSLFYQSYISSISEGIIFPKMFNLYKSIKILISLTEKGIQKKCKYKPFVIKKYFKSKIKNKIKVLKFGKNKENKKSKNNSLTSNPIKIENSLSSIRKAMDLEERDIDTGNEILLLLRNFQKNYKENEIIYNKINTIYKKKKSPTGNFRLISPENRRRNSKYNTIVSIEIYINLKLKYIFFSID